MRWPVMVSTVYLFLFTVQVLIALRDTLLKAKHLLAHLLGFVFRLRSDSDRLLFSFEEGFLLLRLGFGEDLVRLSLC
jgi:hypothetical protein